MATHSSILACRIPWTEESGGLQSIGVSRVRHGWNDLVPRTLWIYHLFAHSTWMGIGGVPNFFLSQVTLLWTPLLCICAQSCLTVCDLMDCSLLGSSVCGIIPARILEWVFLLWGSLRPKDRTCISCTDRRTLYNWATYLIWTLIYIRYRHRWAFLLVI